MSARRRRPTSSRSRSATTGPRGLRAIVAIHSTVLGPALGGTRFWPYATEAEALTDVCRLARGMTYKHAAAGLDQGGGKAVIWGDPRTDRSEALIRAYARFVDGLAGRYLTAEDVGTTQADMDLIRRETPYVTGVSPSLGGSGDPSPATAWGVLWAIRAAAEHRWGSADLAGRHVVVSGVGKVGRALVDHLVDEGARVTVADVTTPPCAVPSTPTAPIGSRWSTRPAPTPSSATCSRPAPSAPSCPRRPSPSCAARSSPARPTTSWPPTTTTTAWRPATSSTSPTTWPTPAA